MQEDPRLAPALASSARTGVQLIGLRVAAYGAGFVASVVIARTLGPGGRGLYVLPLAILGIVMTLSTFGVEHAQVHLAGRGASLRTLWGNGTAIGLGGSLVMWGVIAVAFAATGDALHEGIPVAWIWLGLAQLPLMLQILYWSNILQLSGRVRVGVLAGLAAIVAQALAIVALALGDALTPLGVLLLSGASTVVTWSILLLVGVRTGLAAVSIDRVLLRRALTFGLRAQVGIVFVFLLLRVDQLFVQRLLGFEELGVYSLAVMLAEVLWLVSDPFAAAVLPHQLSAGGEDDVRLGFATARLGLLATTIVATLAWVVSPWAIRLIYGPDFAGAVWAFRWLLPGVVALAVFRPLAGVLLKRGRPGIMALCGAGALVLNVAGDLILIPRVGIAGASVASAGAYVGIAAAYVSITAGKGVAGVRDLVPGRADARMLVLALRSAPRKAR